MSAKDPSRRAVLGAAVGLPLLPRHRKERSDEAIQCGGGGEDGLRRSARNDGEWERALGFGALFAIAWGPGSVLPSLVLGLVGAALG